MLSAPLLALFKVLQQGVRQQQTTKDTLGEMFQKGFRPRAGATGLEAPRSGVGGFLQSFLGGGPGIDWSQFEGPPELVSGPRGSTQRIGDQGRGAAEEVVPGSKLPPIEYNGQLLDPDTMQPVATPKQYTGIEVRKSPNGGWLIGQINPVNQKWEEIANIAPPDTSGDKRASYQSVKLPDGTMAVFDPNPDAGYFVDPAARTPEGPGRGITAPERFTKPPEPRPASDIKAAVQGILDVEATLNGEDGYPEIDDQQRAQLQGLLNELVLSLPEVTRQGLKLPGGAGAGGALGRIEAAGQTPDQPGMGATAVRTIADILKDINNTLQSIPVGRRGTPYGATWPR